MTRDYTEVKGLLDSFLSWFKEESQLVCNKDGTMVIKVPIANQDECICIYVESQGQCYKLSDGGQTLEGLQQADVDISYQDLKNIVHFFPYGFGIDLSDEGAISMYCCKRVFPVTFLLIIKSILAIGAIARQGDWNERKQSRTFN